jgi:hypothetical protein
MSSAVIDSMIWSEFFFRLRALASEARKPVTTTSATSDGSSVFGAAVWAPAWPALNSTMTEAAESKAVRDL